MASVKFEKKPCGRCGGSGHYSYNQINGTVCFECGGSGKSLTERGRAAKKFADAMLTTTVAGVGNRRGKIFTQTSKIVFTGVVAREKSGVRFQDGSHEVMYEPVVKGRPSGTLFSGTYEVRLIPTEEQVAEIAAYQDSLDESGQVREAGVPFDASGEPILIDYDDNF